MCDRSNGSATAPAWQALCGISDHGVSAGSRRRRLWELDDHAHCPVVGVCLPVPALRRLADKTLRNRQALDEYDLHCAMVTACKARTIVAEAAQKALDQRYACAVRMTSRLKTAEALAEHWHSRVHGEDLAGALWATLTHPRCTPELEKHVLGQVHMLQHQVGMAARVDMAAHESLQQAHAALTAQHAALQERQARAAQEHALRQEGLAAEIVRLRAELIARDTALSVAAHDLAELRASIPHFKTREALSRQSAMLQARLDASEKALKCAREDLERERRRADVKTMPAHHEHTVTAAEADASDAPQLVPDLHERSVLCVGGRTAIVPIYRQLVERSGGRFLHHDGGEEHSAASLDATLTAADLVICQTGCISHNAYWRVKSHCKRTGKRCVFTDSPSMTGLKRALEQTHHSTETK